MLYSFAEVMHDRIEPVYARDILEAAELADRHPGVSARDLLHAASCTASALVMYRVGADPIISVDADFDRLPDITRLDPLRVDEWADGPTPCVPARVGI